MKDLREAIFNVFNHSIPVKFTSNKAPLVGYLVNREHMDILLAEYNIHFIEPEDKQEEPYYLQGLIVKDHEIIDLVNHE